MRKSAIGMVSFIAPVILGAIATSGCEEAQKAAEEVDAAFEEVCGPCGVVAEGDVGISGNAKVDGFFAAVAILDRTFVEASGDYLVHIDNLIAAWGVEVAATAAPDAKIAALKAKIDAEITANVEGGLAVNYVAPRCEANVNVAVEAQAKCELKGGCEAMVTPGEVSVSCEGECTGSCSGECTGGFQCDLSAGGECSGECSGSCELEAAAECNGTCRGSCDGTCAAYDGAGNCAGKCEGNCSGTCELSAAASCEGTCTGTCKVEAKADCTGEEPKCSGSCSGQCSGSCKGKATPPQVRANCDASADCEAQASAQASADLKCSPPSLDLGFNFKADVDASAQAEFGARMNALKVEGIAIIQAAGQLSAVFTGKVDGQVVINPSPFAQVQASIQGMASTDAAAEIFADIPAGRITCATEAFSASVATLAQLGSTANIIVTAQAGFVVSLTTGNFGS
jgi:hypothetical protein